MHSGVKGKKFTAPMETKGKGNSGKAHGVCGSAHGPTSVPKENATGQKSLKKGK